jgi:hypothetical protein
MPNRLAIYINTEPIIIAAIWITNNRKTPTNTRFHSFVCDILFLYKIAEFDVLLLTK